MFIYDYDLTETLRMASFKRRLFNLSDAFKKTQEVFGHIDIVVNNAGISGNGQGVFEPNWEKVIDIDLVSFLCYIRNDI